MSINKNIILVFIFLILLLIIPISFAIDDANATVSINETSDYDVLETDENNEFLSNEDQELLSASNDYFFDSSASDDGGDGSKNKPYKYLTADRIKGNSNIYLSNGEYKLDMQKTIENVRIYGEDTSKTIIKFGSVAFKVNNILTLTNVTLIDSSITNYGTVNVINSVFDGGFGSYPDSYGNNYGGAIYTDDSNPNAKVSIRNSIFNNTYAIYGGAIYMGAGTLEVIDSTFVSNYAYNYGGAIACENTVNVTISKSKFKNDVSIDDAGAAIYIKSSKNFKAEDLEFNNCSATFGAAITTLNTDVILSKITANDCISKWDGGAICHMYGKFSLMYGVFTQNKARNGGAIYVDNSSELFMRSNQFIGNNASVSGGAIFSIANTLSGIASLHAYNIFKNNSAAVENNIYSIDSVSLEVGNNNYTLYKFNDTIIDVIPSFYSLIEKGQVSQVKDQQTSGNCWAFTAMAVLESCLKKITGVEFDLSEENMKNLIALYSDYGWQMETNNGGYDAMPFGYFTSWLGPVNEIDDPFDDKSVLSPVISSILHVQNILLLKRDNFTDNDAIKTAIMKYGAVGASIYFDTYYINGGKNYYCWNSYSANHAVTIVGWDDNYSKDNFYFGGTIPGDGAWIVKNSWGPNWGENGYFYVSYYDASFVKAGIEGAAYTFILNDTVRFDKNYQYDIAGKTDYLYNNNHNVWYKNKFTSTDNEMLKGVSTYFEKLTNWTVSIYVNGILKSMKSGSSNAGYYTINLDDDILLYEGDIFEVVFNTTSSGNSAVPISEIASLNKILYTKDISFISYDGEVWQDLFDYTSSYAFHNYYSQVACIKAFTVLADFKTNVSLNVSYNGLNPVTVTATVVDEFNNPVRSGSVMFCMGDENLTVNIVDGKATFTYNFPKGMNSISATFNGKGFISSANSTSFEVSKDNVDLELSVEKYQDFATISISASKGISCKITLSVNGENYTLTLKNGKTEYKLTNLKNGIYNVSAIVTDDVYESEKSNSSFSIDVLKTNIACFDLITTDFSGEEYYVTLVDDDGNPVVGKTVIFTLNNKSFENITGNDGRASIFVNLASGKYTISLRFDGDDNYFQSSNSSLIDVKTNVSIEFKDYIYQNNAVINITSSKAIDATLTLFVNDKNQSVQMTNGFACVNLSNLENRKYLISVGLDDSFVYMQTPLEFEIDIKKTHIVINQTVIADTNMYFMVTLTDEDGNALSNKQIEFKLNGQSIFNVTDINGNAAINLDLEKGSYLVEAIFDDENNFFKSANSSEITIRPDVEVISIDVGNQNQIFVEFKFSKPINESAVLSIGDKNYTLNIVNGQGIIFDDFKNGDYNVSIRLSDDYNFTKEKFNLTISILKTIIIADEFTTTEFSEDEYVITLIDENGNPLSNQTVSVQINDADTYLRTTDDLGKASVPINLSNGIYHVSVKYDVPLNMTDRYFSTIANSKISVKIPIDAEVNISQYLNEANIDIAFTKTINDTVTVYLNDKIMTVNLTNGNASIGLSDLNNGNYTFIMYLDNGSYQFNRAVRMFTVDVKNTKIIADDFMTYYQSGESYSVKLADENGTPLKNSMMTFVFDRNNITVKTDDEGLASIPINLTSGEYVLNIYFNGNNTHVSSMARVKVAVKSSISFENSQYALNSKMTVSLSGNLTDKMVDVTVNGVIYHVKVNNGKASLNVNLKVGSYSVSVANPVTGEVKSQKINVLPRLSGGKNIALYYKSGKKYSVKVYNDNGKAVGSGVTVSFKVKNKVYKVKTNKNGIAALKLNKFKPAKYTITATYKGFKVSNKITVKPTLITKNKSAKKGKTVKFKAKLLNKKGKVLKGKKITFKIKNKKYTAKTNKKGIATIKIKGLKVGKHKITSKFGSIKNTNKIKIKK